MKQTIFEKYKNLTIFSIIAVVILILVGIVELALGHFLGIGKPVIYDSSAIYGYRPLPNKSYQRYIGKKIRFNNLALRSNQDWDENTSEKILFLGDSVTYGGSYISNDELFSTLAVKELNDKLGSKYISGNAGVNAWGVENVFGLVVESGFYPASIYVSTFPEGDFYRGLSRVSGMPFYNSKPKYALEELWLYLCWSQNNKRYKNWESFSSIKDKKYVVNKAIGKLIEIDKILKKRNFTHIIIITPTKKQLLGLEPKDKFLLDLIQQKNIKIIYLVDYLQKLNLDKSTIDKVYHDVIHLNNTGHKIWAKVIAKIIEDKIKI